MPNISYDYGEYDVLRARDLEKLDKRIQLEKNNEDDLFALGIYSEELCNNLGIDEPIKSLKDRMKIMEQIRGIDFVFPVYSLDKESLKTRLHEGYRLYCEKSKEISAKKQKPYQIGYAPGTYDLFHAGHLENLMIASENCEKLVVGVKSNELVWEHKNRMPMISDDERIEILRHFRFVYDVYKYYTRDLHVAESWIKSKYGEGIGAVFLGSDLKSDFKDVKGINVVYTPRDKNKMEKVSTTAYRKRLKLGEPRGNRYTGTSEELERLVNKKDKKEKRDDKNLDTER